MRRPALFLLLALAAPVTVSAHDERPGPFRDAAEPLWDHREQGVGDLLPDLSSKLLDGGDTTLDALVADGPVVLVLRDPDCPLGQRYAPTLAKLQDQLEPHAARFAWLVVGEGLGPDDARRATRDVGLEGPVLLDFDGHAAAALGARTTTEAFLVDAGRTLRYRGAVDDQYGIGFAKDAAEDHFLREAVTALAKGEAPLVRATSAPGCVLELAPPLEREGPPTWHGEIERVVQDQCMSCHRSGGVAPFALETYGQAKRKAAMMSYVVEHDVMPPWGATPSERAWRNDRSLASKDRALLEAWIAADCPEGDPDDAPAPRAWQEGWSIGAPDLVVTGPEIEVPATGTVPYQYFYVQADLLEDRWVRAIEVLPSAGQVVHHVLVFLESPEAGYDGSVRSQGRGGLHGYYAGYIPGQGARDYGPGRAKLLPAGAWLKFQVHYTTNGTAALDTPRIGFVFADEEPREVVKTSGLYNLDLRIPPGADDYSISAEGTFGSEAVLAGFSPHMHLRGKAFRYELEYPDGETEVLLDIPRYDFNWQTMYELAEPLSVPAGTVLRATAWYDNSADNPANPDPRAEVRFGEQTWDEMMIAYFEWWRAEDGGR